MITHIVNMLEEIKNLYGDTLRIARVGYYRKTREEFAALLGITVEELENLESVQDHAIYPLD